jgi:membrane protein DedA with SNARE-associated domain
VEWLIASLDKFTYIGIALSLFVAGLGVPVPEDIPLIFGGAMAGAGKINVYIHFGISMAFILIGDSCLYYIGRRLGNASEGKGFFAKLLTPSRRAKAQGYYDRFGNWTVFFGRFVAGIRGAIFLSAGVVRFPFWRFLLLDFLAALISVPVWIYLGWTFGENWEVILEKAKAAQGWVLGGIALVVISVFVALKMRKRAKARAEETAAQLAATKAVIDQVHPLAEAPTEPAP